MNRLLVTLAITAAAGSLLYSSPIGAQNPPPEKRAEHVEILNVASVFANTQATDLAS
jgi:hypothetical protein